jgi:probable F420-dependent oxidoreductase
MQHGIVTFVTDYGIGPVELARAVEERGFDALFLTEHTHIPTSRLSPWPGGDELPRKYSHTYDPFVALGAAAAVTSTIALGTAVSLVVQHDPIVLAKAVASVDRISGGRFELGVGPGWNREEMGNHGVDPSTRTARMREHVLAMQRIWADDEAEFHGRFVDFDPIWSWPKPVRTPPILIGGSGPTVLDRVLEYGGGWIPIRGPQSGSDEFARRVAELRARTAEAGREHIPVTLYGGSTNPAALQSYAEAGVDRVLFEVPDQGADEVRKVLDELVAQLR